MNRLPNINYAKSLSGTDVYSDQSITILDGVVTSVGIKTNNLQVFQDSLLQGNVVIDGNLQLAGQDVETQLLSLQTDVNALEAINAGTRLTTLENEVNALGANDTTVVHIAGDEKISGNKTFTGVTAFADIELNSTDLQQSLDTLFDNAVYIDEKTVAITYTDSTVTTKIDSKCDIAGNVKIGESSLLPSTITSITYYYDVYGESNLKVATIVVPQQSRAVINCVIPFSVYRSAYQEMGGYGLAGNLNYGSVRETMNGATFTVKKNGSNFVSGNMIFQGFTTYVNSTANYWDSHADYSTFNYHVYMGSGTAQFTPFYNLNTADTYDVYVTPTKTSKIIGNIDTIGYWANYGYYCNTTKPNSDFSRCEFNSTNSYKTPRVANNTYLTNDPYYASAISCTVNGSLETNILKVNSSVIQPTFPCGYFLDGTVSTVGTYAYYPVLCSSARIQPDADDVWVVMPGYKFKLYDAYDYVNFLGDIINYTGTIPLSIRSADVYGTKNCCASVKVYYLDGGNEVFLPYIS
jgi:hypothetical protein